MGSLYQTVAHDCESVAWEQVLSESNSILVMECRCPVMAAKG